MRHPTLDAVADLVALRRKQAAVVLDAVQAALDLEEVVQAQAATLTFNTIDDFLRTAPNEETRAIWSSWIDRATAHIPDTLEDTQ